MPVTQMVDDFWMVIETQREGSDIRQQLRMNSLHNKSTKRYSRMSYCVLSNSDIEKVFELYIEVSGWQLSIPRVLYDLSSVLSSRKVVAAFSGISTSPLVRRQRIC